MYRHAATDEQYQRVQHLLPGRRGQQGRPARDNRLFLDAVLWIGKTGVPWRDLPERFGRWNSVCRRFSRWAKSGVWLKVFAALQEPDLEWLLLDSTIVRAHQHAAGAEKKPAPGTARGPSAGPLAWRPQHQGACVR
jgi:transposase